MKRVWLRIGLLTVTSLSLSRWQRRTFMQVSNISAATSLRSVVDRVSARKTTTFRINCSRAAAILLPPSQQPRRREAGSVAYCRENQRQPDDDAVRPDPDHLRHNGQGWLFKKNIEIEGRSRVVGSVQILGHARNSGQERKNMVVWELYENEKLKTAILTFVQAAALLKRGKTPEHPGGEEFSIDIAISGEVDRRKSVRDIWGSASTRNFSGKSSKGEAVIFDPKQSRGTVGRLQAVGESLGAGGGEAPGTGASTHRDAGKEDAESINRSDEGGKELATGDLTAGRCRTRHVGRRRSSLRHWLDGRGC
ncbi:hypothetical protein BGZ61DRAFT_475526 [Ilyonectria robusta]|uniref:uncharacterized protein n=1 Tax=Ilyonectria robusta TaxID=1079257 RepID=UPI001E8EB16C|nr:uncharacterized protein BGZ61DRAFT_475526 [Ilyonectria robusta]KAH8729966.1 hypothetical protein BGZ61DRAFT_475526 [Ilyonectria robusta]